MSFYGIGLRGSGVPAGAGEANDGANVGIGIGLIFKDKTGIFLNFKSLIAGSGITINNNLNDIEIISTGEINTSSNDGLGVQLAKAKVGLDLPFRSVVDSSTIDWVQNVDDIVASIVALSITNALISAGANIDKTKISTVGSWLAAEIPSLDTGKITTGIFVDARIPNLDTGKITTGIFVDARIPNLATSKITSGQFVIARLTRAVDSLFLRGTGVASDPVYEAIEISKGGTILDPDVRNIIVWRAPFPCTVTNVRGYRVGGTTASINARKNGTDNHLAADNIIGATNIWDDGGAVQNTAYATGDKLEIMITVVSGAPTQVAVQVDFTRP